MLKTIGLHFRRLLKINEHTGNLSRAKFTRIYVEINLSKLLR